MRSDIETHKRIQSGAKQVVEVIRPTLGPFNRQVWAGEPRGLPPQPLACGGLIAKRLLRLEWGQQAIGAQLLASHLSQLYDDIGDGVATAAVMFQVLAARGFKYCAAGGNVMILRRHLEAGLRGLLQEIDRRRVPVRGQMQLTRLASSLCEESDIATHLGEVLDVVGEMGRLEIVESHSAETQHDYVEGIYWERGMVSRFMANHPDQCEAHLEDPAIFLSNYYIHEPSHLLPVLEAASEAGSKSLLLVSTGFSDKAIGLLTLAANRERLPTLAVEPPFVGDARLDFLHDLAALTGATPIWRTGDLETELVHSSIHNLTHIRPEQFGRARRVWATPTMTGICGSRGEPRSFRHYLADLRRRYERETKAIAREAIRQRLGKLLGGSATLWVGGGSSRQLKQRKETAERTARVLRNALREGIVAGGGAALLDCLDWLEARRQNSASLDESMAYQLLGEMVQAPTYTLLNNAGLEPKRLINQARHAGPGYAYDVLNRRLANMMDAGIWDVATVIKASLRTAVSTAVMALTVEAIVPSRRRASQR